MTASPLNLMGSIQPAQVQENMISYMRLFAGLPGVITYDADLFWIVSNLPAPGNAILRTSWSENNLEEKIDKLFEQVSEYTNHIDWLIFPGDSPDNLGEHLEARGMPGGKAGNWLLADLTSLCPDPPVPDHFHIEQVHNDRMMAEWVQVSEAGFKEDLALFYQAYARHGYGPDAFSLHYTGYLNDTPVTSGTLLDSGGSAAIYDISTPPAFRGQGFGGAITHSIMKEIRQRGYDETWIWSSNIGKSVYQKLGYVDADFGQREHVWHKPGG